MVKIIKASLSLLLVIVFQSTLAQNGDKSKVSINKGWKFNLIEQNESDDSFEKSTFNDADWQQVSLPHTANVEPYLVNDQWQGICWYRKELKTPKIYKGQRIILEFEGAMNYSELWINDVLVSKHDGGFLPVVVDVTDYLFGKKGLAKKMSLAIRLDNRDNPVTGPKPLKRLDFNTFGGLYRNAWIIVKNDVHISHAAIANKVAGGGVFVTYPKVKAKESVVKVQTHVVNNGKKAANVEVVNSLYFNGALVKESKESAKVDERSNQHQVTEIRVKNAKLWSPDVPNLYTLETKVLKNGKVVDKQVQRIGIREFTFQKDQLYINGKKTFLRGVNRHQEYPFIGYALSDNAQYRDAKKIKDGGFNYIRLSHYPQSPAFMDACDELGIVVIDAIMGWQYYGDNNAFRDYCYRSASQLIRRDRNHACVLAWEVSLNETQMPIFFMEELDKIVHAEYPGEHVYSCGWMHEVYDIYLQARQHRIMHPMHLKDGQPYSVSEYGDWEYYSKNAGLNQDNLPNDMRDEYSSRQARGYGEQRLLRQAYNVQEAHNDNLKTKAYSDSYWVMYDYNRGYHNTVEESGLMDLFRISKFGYDFYQSQREVKDGGVLKIASYWNKKSPLDVKVYSNYDEVALYLNGKLVAKKKPDTDKNSTLLNHPPFTFNVKKFKAGTLKAVAYAKGKKVATTEVKTPGKVAGLKVWLDESGKKAEAGVNDVVFLYVAAVDKNGTIVPYYSEEVSFSIKGDAQLMNVGAIKAEAGIATGLLMVGDKKEKIEVKVTTAKFSKTYSLAL